MHNSISGYWHLWHRPPSTDPITERFSNFLIGELVGRSEEQGKRLRGIETTREEEGGPPGQVSSWRVKEGIALLDLNETRREQDKARGKLQDQWKSFGFFYLQRACYFSENPPFLDSERKATKRNGLTWIKDVRWREGNQTGLLLLRLI